MQSSVAVILSFTILYYVACSANSMSITETWVCQSCLTQEECEQKPTSRCVWGEARDACNRRICAKGPDERCGGFYNVLGVCGEGMMCKSDERCHGCSINSMGPGERCGGSLNILGVCGEGMMCKSDERCYGCSIQTLECNN